jgi:thioredoxin 1
MDDRMNGSSRILIALLLAGAIAAVLVLKNANRKPDKPVPVAPTVEETEREPLPRLVDLGADKCIPCKAMAPILDELKVDQAGTFDVEFIDVWKNPEAGEEYDVSIIPTQIFYDSEGTELFRYEGFFGKEEILAKWQEFGVMAAAETEE